MSYKNLTCLGLVLIFWAALLAVTTSAESITVLNNSFQDPVRADGLDGSATNWTASGSGAGVWNPNSPYFTNAAGDGTPPGADGSQILYFSGGPKYSYQVLADTLLSGTYTLTVAVGKGIGLSKDTDTYAFSLSTADLGGLQSGSPLATKTGGITSQTEGEFADQSLSLIVYPDSVNMGQALRVDLGSLGGWAFFDNVRLDYSTAVPEPSMLALLAAGLLALAFARKR